MWLSVKNLEWEKLANLANHRLFVNILLAGYFCLQSNVSIHLAHCQCFTIQLLQMSPFANTPLSLQNFWTYNIILLFKCIFIALIY